MSPDHLFRLVKKNERNEDMEIVKRLGNLTSDNVFIQMVDDHDLEVMEGEIETLRQLSGGEDWALVAVKVDDWNSDLTPWKADPVFGKEGFGDGASVTLEYLLENVIPEFQREGRRFYIAGYSLAGLFALWTAYETDVFEGAVAASPSVWYPGWTDYAEKHDFRAERAYLSLGDKESKTRNQVMAKVGDNILRQDEIFRNSGVECKFEWNPGNHFRDADKRTAKGMAWMLK